MTGEIQMGFESVEEFLAHGHGLEQEMAQCYAVLADSMEVHGNHTVARLFRKLSRYGESHAEKLISHAAGADLLKVAPWEYQWLCHKETENCHEGAHYLMTSHEALTLALRIEKSGQAFYRQTIHCSQNSAVKKLAVQMVQVKEEHLALLRDWLLAAEDEHQPVPEDLDPPNTPE